MDKKKRSWLITALCSVVCVGIAGICIGTCDCSGSDNSSSSAEQSSVIESSSETEESSETGVSSEEVISSEEVESSEEIISSEEPESSEVEISSEEESSELQESEKIPVGSELETSEPPESGEPVGSEPEASSSDEEDSSEDEDSSSEEHAHYWVVDEIIDPTCTQKGYTAYICDGCEDGRYIGDWVDALGHAYEITEYVDATCTQDGYILFTCDRCGGTKTQIIKATGHEFGDDNVCDKCGYTVSAHTHSYTQTVVNPTCKDMGYTKYTCDCGHEYKTNYIEALGHKFDDGVETQEKTCTQDGEMKYTCERCGEYYTEVIPAGHNWSETVTKPATCTQDGEKSKVCLACGAKEKEVIPAGHTWEEKRVIKEPKCKEEGEIEYECSVCHETKTEKVKELGHYFVNGVCQRCGAKFMDDITEDINHPEYGMYFVVDEIVSAYGPIPVDEYGVYLHYNAGAQIERVAVYLTQDGTMWRRCIACTGTNIEYATYVPYLSNDGEMKYTGLNSDMINIFPLSENSDGIWCYSDYATIGVNLEDNKGNLLLSLYDIGQAGAKTKLFDSLPEMIAWLKNECYTHDWDEWVETKPATCAAGEERRDCKNCEAYETQTVAPIADHVWGEWTETTPAGCESKGEKRRDCGNCDEYQTQEIPEKGHSYTQLKYDDIQHWYECECGDVQAGSLEGHYGGTATTTEKAKCTICGQSYGELATPVEPDPTDPVLPGPTTYEKLADGTVNFGAYPQTKVTDSALTTALTSAAGALPTASNSQNWTSYQYYIENSNAVDYMWYQDVVYGGNSYRGVYFTSYRPYYTPFTSSTGNTYQDDNGYYTGIVYWFAYETLNWTVLEESNGEMFLLCNSIIDSQEYYHDYDEIRTINGVTVYPNNYAESNIRKWLNETFYETAFTSLQQSLIKITEVDNSAKSTNPYGNPTKWNSGVNQYACANTNDKIFLLSEEEVTNSNYGFASYSIKDTARYRKPSEYALSQGCYTNTSSSYRGNGWWWLRSPSYDYNYGARSVGDNGGANNHIYVDIMDNDYSYYRVFYTYGGVVPALKLAI